MRYRYAYLKLGSIVLLLSVFLSACSGSSSTPSSFQTTTRTSDGMFQIQFIVTPDHSGLNTFTVKVADASSGKAATNIQVRLTTTMLDMDMGTNTVNLQSNGQGSYSAQGELSMNGDWQIGVQVRTPDNVLHKATVNLSTSA